MLSPKQIGTICFTIFSFIFSAPLFATGIPSNVSTADCKNSTLSTYSGTSNLEANWDANIITLHWYSEDNEIQNVPSTSQSCTYDGSLEPLPVSNVPTREGYTFRGWRARQAGAGQQVQQCSLSSLDTSIGGTWYASKGSTGYCYYYNDDTGDEVDGDCSDSHFAGLNNSEWETNFSYGTVKGMAKCSNTNGDYATVGTPSNTNGQYCWCAATSYTPDGGTQCNIASPSWVFYGDVDSASLCANGCADDCAYRVLYYPDFRRAVFGVSQ